MSTKSTKKICLYRNHIFMKSFLIDGGYVRLDHFDPLPYIFQAVDFEDLLSILMNIGKEDSGVKYIGKEPVLKSFFHWYALVYKKYFGLDVECESLYGEDLYFVLFKDKEFRKRLNREVYKTLLVRTY